MSCQELIHNDGSGLAGHKSRRSRVTDAVPLRTLAVDFNSYFASCEQQENPTLRGKPVAVVPVIADTTCCISVSYAAKARGVRAEMGVNEAKIRCPELALVEARPEVYIAYHRELREIIESCIHITEIKSIDEMECDLTATFAPLEKALGVAKSVKTKIHRQIGPCLTSSIGLAPNWMLAKMATDMRKPDGLVVLEDKDIPERLMGLKLQDFLGIGERMEVRLLAHGIDTPAKLYAATKAQLRGIWGSVEGERMYGRLRGEPIPFVSEGNKTIGHSHVLPPALRSDTKALAVLHRLLQKAAMRLRNIRHFAGSLSVYVGYRDGVKWSEEVRFNETQDMFAMTRALNLAWQRRPQDYRFMIPMQVGIVLTRLISMGGHTPDLFEVEKEPAKERLQQAVDVLNQTYGHGTVYLGGAFGVTKNAPMRIAYTRIPAPEIEEIDHARERRVRPLKMQPPTEDAFGNPLDLGTLP